MGEYINTKINEQNQKQIRKMKKYIRTFPLKSEEIILIYKDIDGMAEEAEVRGESFENMLGKSPKEFCDELMYAVGGIKAPGGRKLLRFAGAYYKIVGFILLFSGGMSLTITFLSCIVSLFEQGLDMLYWIVLLISDVGTVLFGLIFYIAGKKFIRYSSDVSKTTQAMCWGIGMFLFGSIIQVLSMKYSGDIFIISNGASQVLVYINVLCFIFLICASLAGILGAIRNRPHMEA